MAPTVQKDANGNTVCRRDSQGRKIACTKCITGHRTSMCKPSHTEGVRVIDGVGRKQGTKNRRKNGRLAAKSAASFLQQTGDQARSSDDEIHMGSLQSLPQMQADFSSGESTPQSMQGLQFQTHPQPRPNWVAHVPRLGPYPEMQANHPVGNYGAAAGQPQQKEMAQQFADLGVWHDPMYGTQVYQPFGYPGLNSGEHLQMQEPQPLADIQVRGFMSHDQCVEQPLPPNLGATSNGIPLQQNMAQSQHPVQPAEVDYLADHEQFDKIFPLTKETLDWGTSLLQELEREKGLQWKRLLFLRD